MTQTEKWKQNQQAITVCPDCKGTGKIIQVMGSRRYPRRCYRCERRRR